MPVNPIAISNAFAADVNEADMTDVHISKSP
jgi:hypothetical protein